MKANHDRGTRRARQALAGAALAGAVLALGASATVALASAPHGPPPPPPPLEERIESLDLDDATRDKIYAVLDAAEGARRQTQRALESSRRRMRALLADATASDEAIRAADRELDELEHRAHQQRTDVLLKVRAALPEKMRGSLAPPARGERPEGRGQGRDGGPRRGGRCGDGPDRGDDPAGPRER